ncbi:NAD-dependent epimerase/dehydratase family protein [Roseomonas sp. CCTCC AB2023176]|uniref:NAD-dependent epimerase/dehydratase family protein n=1 Tax=Roseomonas sp. CCTCC AB2023176 TaxID=3342640 RepID=UPI0035E1DCFD
MNHRVLVTGASGFLGARIAAALAAEPMVAEVLGLDRAEPPPGVPWRPVVAGLNRLGDALPRDWVADAVVHGAALTSQASEADPDAAYAVNVEGTRAVLGRCQAWAERTGRPPRLVLLSSVSVFGGGGEAADEATPPDPRTTYGTTKLIAERLVLDATRRGAVDGVVLRLPISTIRTERSGKPGAGFVSDLILQALRGEPFTAPLPLDHRLPVGSVASSVALAVRAALHAAPGRVLHAPSLTVSAASARDDVARFCAANPVVTAAPDPLVDRLVAGWPKRLSTLYPGWSARLTELSLAEVIRRHVAAHAVA